MNHGIIKGESIADHMYRMALMSLIAGDIPGLNRERFHLFLYTIHHILYFLWILILSVALHLFLFGFGFEQVYKDCYCA